MIISDIQYIWSRFKLNKKIRKLAIEKAGVDEDGVPYIKLQNGPVFFGLRSSPKDKKYYNLLPKKYREKLPFSSFKVANDIIIRYMEGGLKYGGPKKESFYKTKAGDYVAEMGAYMGHYTIYLSEKVGPSGKVIAIEPLPDNIEILKKNIKGNNLQNVLIVPKGIWKEKSIMNFHRKIGDHQSGSIDLKYDSNDSYSIPVDSLDNILSDLKIEFINFMLIQLNGVEPEALEGLTKYNPLNFAIAARYSKQEKKAIHIIKDILIERGYKCIILNRDFIFAELMK